MHEVAKLICLFLDHPKLVTTWGHEDPVFFHIYKMLALLAKTPNVSKVEESEDHSIVSLIVEVVDA